MLAYRRADVRDLNDAARTLLARAGELGTDALEAGGHEFRVGDRVLCRHNDERLGLRNGTRATVIALDDDQLMMHTDGGALRTVDRRYAAEHLEHGYALTGHAAQGATVERAFVLLHDQGALQEWGYVACTRAREQTRLYLAAEAPERDTHGREPDGRRAPERLTRALTTSAAERLALEQARTTARLRTVERQQLEQTRARAARRLSQAEQTLDRLGWRNRRKQGAEVRADIELQRHALREADEKLARLRALPKLEPPAPSRQAATFARDRSLDRRAHDQLELSSSRHHERDLGIDR
jgi:hypothetical protein